MPDSICQGNAKFSNYQALATLQKNHLTSYIKLISGHILSTASRPEAHIMPKIYIDMLEKI